MGTRSRLTLACCLAGLLMAGSVQAHDDATEEGIASFYSDTFQGAPTASGEPFDQQALTAAHPSLPFGTKVLVTRPDTGQEVEVLINDRGPFVQGRVIDLSKHAARKLGMLHRGVAPVMITQVN
ncbi:septal ring lytic transglycosylase RlpA family protein [Halomonas heilongjiangensis]|uniref:Endolytic peptidoglycan transglycosylase RlpA n=1 Tax=Halomonas heilongjiangensis TaxID=1387883 RepID=A0A2N7TVH1_9GAMM|nr:septal ring lytic transglycosylase RlpA family lipoprotein [Halomonas heilongjiangensis]PXX91416.1 septal ring lytic transglycosylase RlpA family lipoprotein [Halomonas heilongjiangensis]